MYTIMCIDMCIESVYIWQVIDLSFQFLLLPISVAKNSHNRDSFDESHGLSITEHALVNKSKRETSGA